MKKKYQSTYDVNNINEPLPLLAAGSYQEEPEAM